MSTRAIAPVVGVSDMTVRRDQQAGATGVAPEPDSADLAADDVEEAELVEDTATVTGIDGKTYPRPTATARRTRARCANWTLSLSEHHSPAFAPHVGHLTEIGAGSGCTIGVRAAGDRSVIPSTPADAAPAACPRRDAASRRPGADR